MNMKKRRSILDIKLWQQMVVAYSSNGHSVVTRTWGWWLLLEHEIGKVISSQQFKDSFSVVDISKPDKNERKWETSTWGKQKVHFCALISQHVKNSSSRTELYKSLYLVVELFSNQQQKINQILKTGFLLNGQTSWSSPIICLSTGTIAGDNIGLTYSIHLSGMNEILGSVGHICDEDKIYFLQNTEPLYWKAQRLQCANGRSSIRSTKCTKAAVWIHRNTIKCYTVLKQRKYRRWHQPMA